MRYGWYAERYGWPPTVVDEQPAWVLLQLPVYAGVVDEAKATLRKEAERAAERKARAAGGR